MDGADLRKALTSLAASDWAKLVANIPGAADQVPEQGTTVSERALRLIQWAESSTGLGLEEIDRIAKGVLPNFG